VLEHAPDVHRLDGSLVVHLHLLPAVSGCLSSRRASALGRGFLAKISARRHARLEAQNALLPVQMRQNAGPTPPSSRTRVLLRRADSPHTMSFEVFLPNMCVLLV